MTISVLCESPRVRHPQEKCASKCVRSIVSLCLHLFFITYELNFVLCALFFYGPVAQLESERDRAKVEVTRSNRVSPPKQSSKYKVQNTELELWPRGEAPGCQPG